MSTTPDWQNLIFEAATEHGWRLAPDAEHNQWTFYRPGYFSVAVTFGDKTSRVTALELGPIALGRDAAFKAPLAIQVLSNDTLKRQPGVEVPYVVYQPVEKAA
jgi:hypothetical protein